MPSLSRWFSRTADGFTLIEVLMALTLLALLLTGLYGSFDQSTRVQRIVEEQRDVYSQARLAVVLLTDEFAAAYRPDTNDRQPELFLTGTKGGTDEDRQDRIEFVTLAESEGLRKVTVYLEERDGVRRLIHKAEPLIAGTTATVELVEGVKAFTLRYYDGSAWVDRWDGLSMRRVPWAIGLKLVVGGKAGRTWTFATAMDIPGGRQI